MEKEGESCPVSSTYQYRKVMKPLLERKRRARINSCLEELKELMEFVGGQNGERMQRLEKADVLEVTVNHLRNLKAGGRLGTNMNCSSSFRGGYSACAREVASFISSPYSGVHQEQAIRIAMGVADGLRSLQIPTQQEDSLLENAKNIQPRNAQQILLNIPQIASNTSTERTNVESTLSAPLDLTTRLKK